MPRLPSVSCPTCAKLYEVSQQHRKPGYVQLATLGTLSGPPMKRVYAKAPGRRWSWGFCIQSVAAGRARRSWC